MNANVRSLFCVDCGASSHEQLASEIATLARDLGGEAQLIRISGAVSGVGVSVPDSATQRMRAGLHLAGASTVEMEAGQHGQIFFIMLATTQPAASKGEETWIVE